MTAKTSAFITAVPSAVITLTDTHRKLNGVECGSLGALVLRDGHAGFLTCNHVVALNGYMPRGNPVGMRMSSGFSRRVGSLASWDPLDDSPGAENLTDSALVLFDPEVEPRLDLSRLGDDKEMRYRAGTPRLGGRVIKYGPKSGLTRGWIESIDHARLVHHDFGSFYFRSQVAICGDSGRPFAGPGDSGALVFSDEKGVPREPVAMIWGGKEGLTFASPLEVCLTRLGVSLAGS